MNIAPKACQSHSARYRFKDFVRMGIALELLAPSGY